MSGNVSGHWDHFYALEKRVEACRQRGGNTVSVGLPVLSVLIAAARRDKAAMEALGQIYELASDGRAMEAEAH